MKLIRERFNRPVALKERSSIVGSIGNFDRDIYRERLWSPHEEMIECVKMYNENSLAQAAINTMKEFITGGQIKVIADDERTARAGTAYIESIGMLDFTSEIVENTIKTGNGYLECDFDRMTKLRKRFYPIADSSRMYLNIDIYGNAKKTQKLVMRKGEYKYITVDNDDEFFLQQVDPSQMIPQAKWYDMSYYFGSMLRRFRIYAIPIHRDKMIHFKLNIGDTGVYGRSYMASALNDNLALRQVEESLATIAKFKAVPRDVLQYGDENMPAESEELDEFIAYMESLEKDETAIINKPIKREVLSYAGQDINLDYVIQHLRKKIIAGIAPDFMMGLGDQVNRATAGQALLAYVLAIYSKRRLFLKPLERYILYPWLLHHGFKVDNVHLEFGQLDFETKSEKESRVLQSWNSNVLTLNQTLEELGKPQIGKEGDVYSLDWQNQMMPDLMGGFGDFSQPEEGMSDFSTTPQKTTSDDEEVSEANSYTESLTKFPHNPTGTKTLQKQMAVMIRSAYRERLKEILSTLEKNKKLYEEKIMTEATIGVEAIDNILSKMIGLNLLLKPIINEFIKKAYDKGNSAVARVLNVGTFVPYEKRQLQALQKNAFGYIKDFGEEKKEELRGILTEGVSQGDRVSEISKEIKQSFNTVAWKSEQIARTEMIRTYNEAAVQATNQSGVTKEVRYVTAHDDRVCPECRPNHMKIFKTNQLKENVNKPPLHPNCRCGLVPYVGPKEEE